MVNELKEHQVNEETFLIEIPANRSFEIPNYCRSFVKENGELLTISYAPDLFKVNFLFLLPNDSMKYKILSLECNDKKLDSIRQYFKVAEIYEYELYVQYGFTIVTKFVDDDYKFINAQNPVDLSVHQKNSEIKFVEVGLGFHYRNIENEIKLLIPDQILLQITKLFNTCTTAHQIGFVTAIEKLSNTKVSEETKYSRMLLAELERVTNHLLWLGMLYMGMGKHELTHKVMKLKSKVEGIKAKIIVSKTPAIIFENQAYSLTKAHIEFAKNEIIELLSNLRLLIDDKDYRGCMGLLDQVGILETDESRKLGTVGPVARAAGIKTDVRISEPYLLYDSMRLLIEEGSRGTMKDIAEVRFKEISSSLSIINQILYNCEPWDAKPFDFAPMLLPNKAAIVNVEAPNGRMTYLIITDDRRRISQFRITIPSVTNFISIIRRMKGSGLRWLPTISRLFDMGIDPLDNLIVVDVETGLGKSVSAHEIRQDSANSIIHDRDMIFN